MRQAIANPFRFHSRTFPQAYGFPHFSTGAKARKRNETASAPLRLSALRHRRCFERRANPAVFHESLLQAYSCVRTETALCLRKPLCKRRNERTAIGRKRAPSHRSAAHPWDMPAHIGRIRHSGFQQKQFGLSFPAILANGTIGSAKDIL